jgi:hypothetical protein
MDHRVATAERRELSDADIRRALPGIKIWTQPELAKLRSVDDLFDDQGRAVILFLTRSKREGHWTALWRTPSGELEFFDSYGRSPDSERAWLSPAQRRRLGETEPVLTQLLRRQHHPVIVSKLRLQSSDPAIQTCGDHVIARLLHKEMSDRQYWLLIQREAGGDADKFAAAVVLKLLSAASTKRHHDHSR